MPYRTYDMTLAVDWALQTNYRSTYLNSGLCQEEFQFQSRRLSDEDIHTQNNMTVSVQSP